MTVDFKKENQIATNKLIEIVLLIKSIVGILLFILILFENKVPYFLIVYKTIFLPLYSISLLLHFVLKKNGFDKQSTSTILLVEMIVSFSLSYLIFTNYVILFITIPVILTVRNLNRKETHLIGFCTWLAFVLSIILNIHLHRVSSLFQEIHAYQELLLWTDPHSVFLYYFVPTTFAFFMVIVVTDNIIVNSRKKLKMIIDQSARIAVLNSEMSMASQIQMNALPAQSFSTPGNLISIKASEKPAKEVGGDFFDYMMLDKNHFAFLVADVSDKGVSAAMFMMAAQKIIRIALQNTNDLGQAIRSANKLLCQENTNNMFLTLWAGVADLEKQTIEYVNCGHQKPVMISCDNICLVNNKPNLILGCFEEINITVNSMTYSSKDKLVIYTDGITDIRNKEDKSFGEERLLQALKKGITNPENLISHCLDFAKDVPQFDDMTVMEVSFN